VTVRRALLRGGGSGIANDRIYARDKKLGLEFGRLTQWD
jgi:hypothetical protein